MIDKITLLVSSDEDIENISLTEDWKINHLHLELNDEKNKISQKYFFLLFEKLAKIDAYNRFHLMMTNFDADDEKINSIVNTLSKWSLKEINFNFSDSKFTDKQFDTLINKTLSRMKSLERIHFTLENIDLNSDKIHSINTMLNYKNDWKHVFINIKRNKILSEDLFELTKTVQRFYNKEIHF